MKPENPSNQINLYEAQRHLLDRPHPTRPVTQSENLLPYYVPGFECPASNQFDPLPTTGKLRTLAHMAGLPPTREVLQTLIEQTELALISLREPEGRRELLLDQVQICEATVRWLLHEATKQPRMAGKLTSAAMAVQSNLARLIVLLDQTEGLPIIGPILKHVGNVRVEGEPENEPPSEPVNVRDGEA